MSDSLVQVLDGLPECPSCRYSSLQGVETGDGARALALLAAVVLGYRWLRRSVRRRR